MIDFIPFYLSLYNSNSNKPWNFYPISSVNDEDAANTSLAYVKKFFDWRFVLLTPPMAYIAFFMTMVVSEYIVINVSFSKE